MTLSRLAPFFMLAGSSTPSVTAVQAQGAGRLAEARTEASTEARVGVPAHNPGRPTDTLSAAQWADSARVAIEAAFAAGSADGVARARLIADQGVERFPSDAWLRHYQGYALFREGLLREGDAARATFERARESLERSITLRDLSESHAVLAAVFGNLVGGSVLRAVRFGRTSMGEMDRAVALGPENPRVWMLKGAGALFQPTWTGGGAEKGEASLRKAVALFANDHPAPGAPAWGRAETHGYLALALAKQGKQAEARAALAPGLAIDATHSFLRVRVKPKVDPATPP